jgi:hypothetical protein
LVYGRGAVVRPFAFYLGTPHPDWVGRLLPEITEDRRGAPVRHLAVPLFLSYRHMRRWHLHRPLPRAVDRWALDSGGFQELSLYGRWTIPQAEYAASVKRFSREIGKLEWAAIQDWMCEERILRKTGLSLREHQRRTLRSYLELRSAAPDVHWRPVLQGWELGDYLRHVDDYLRAGVDPFRLPVVGVGSVCRRQKCQAAQELLGRLTDEGLPVHGFGLKTLALSSVGLRRAPDGRQWPSALWQVLVSADSMAWSMEASWAHEHAKRRGHPEQGCLLYCRGGSHWTCSNCPVYAMHWRRKLLQKLAAAAARAQSTQYQLSLW